jgi:hypothetical protein
VLILAHRHRRPAWLLPGLVGAMLSGVSIAATLSVWDLISIVRSILTSGSGGLASFGQGVWDANHTWLFGLQVSLVATLVIGLAYLLPRRRTAAETWAPRPILASVFSLIPLAGAAIAFVTFFAMGQRLIASASEAVPPASTRALVTGSAWIVAAAGATAASFCVLNVLLFPLFRTRGAAPLGVQRTTAGLLVIAALFVVAALGMVIAFNRQMSALAGTVQ